MKGFRALSENFDLAEAMGGVRVDDANGVLHDVVLLTGNKTSLNKTHYTDKALAEAVTRYEGAKMFINHPRSGETNRSIQDFGGVYKDVKLVGNQVKANLHLLESQRATVMAIAKMKPAGIGLSIKDKGRGVEKDGVFFVEGFAPKASYSIDMVCDPSVNKDLFEAAQNEDEGGEDMDLKTLTLEALTKERQDLVESIQNAGKAAILKELEEAKANGAKSEAMAAKLQALIEADFSKDISEAVKKMIMPDGVTLEMAKGMILGQKEVIESLSKKKTTTTAKPVVTGMGARKDDVVVEEGATDLPTDDDILSAFHR